MSFSAHDLNAALDETLLSTQSAHAVALMASVVHSSGSAAIAIGVLRQREADEVLVSELLLQSTLFAGFPRALNALHAFREVFGEASTPPRSLQPEDLERFRVQGEALFRDIYRSQADRVLQMLDTYHPELKDWILVSAYGRVLSREGVSPSIRELAACAALMVSGDLRQLSSHARGARHTGATDDEVRQTAELVACLTGQPIPDEIG